MSKATPTDAAAAQNTQRTRQPDNVKSSSPGYGDKKLEGPNRPST